MTVIDLITIILSVVALIVTIIGFFASLKFYRDGVQLQESANRALIKIEEKSNTIQTQVGGMFDKTLDAVIGQQKGLMDELHTKTENVEKYIREEGHGKKEELELIKSIGEITELIDLSRENIENIMSANIESLSQSLESRVKTYFFLKPNQWITHAELKNVLKIEKMDSLNLFKILRDLQESEFLIPNKTKEDTSYKYNSRYKRGIKTESESSEN